MSKPEIFTTAYVVDMESWIHLSDNADFMEHIRTHLGHQLAERIFQECRSGEKIVTVGNTYEKEIPEIYQVEIRETVSIEKLVRCKDCKWFNDSGCAIRIVDESDKPSENDFCSFGERRSECIF